MIMLNRIAVIILVACISLCSCDDYLNVNPPSEVINDDIFSHSKGVESAINGVYSKLASPSLYGDNIWSYSEILGQNIAPPFGSGSLEALAIYDYQQSNLREQISKIWIEAYEVIGECNNIINNLEDKDPEQWPLYNHYLGEMYGVRAFLHFELLRLFAPNVSHGASSNGIPYVTEYSYNITPFSNVKDAYQKVIGDLKKSQQLLKADIDLITYPRTDSDVKDNFSKGKIMHFNYYASTALMARVYWMMNDLQHAKEEALKVVNSESFPFVEKDEVGNLISGSLSNKETIFGVYSKSYFESTKSLFYDGKGGIAMGLYEAPWFPLKWNQVFEKDYSVDAGQDFRQSGWFVNLGYVHKFYKLVDLERINNNGISPESRGLYEGVSIIRIPEMYYILAEAELEQGSVLEAEKLLSLVVESRGLKPFRDREPVVVVNQEVVYNERHKEFFGEGMRWMELKKLNSEITSNFEVKTIPASDDVYVLPIPDEEFSYR